MFLLLCTSCVEQKDTTSIKIDLMATDSDTLYYSSFVDSLSYIPLETKDDCLRKGFGNEQYYNRRVKGIVTGVLCDH